MSASIDVVAVGELIVDFTQSGTSESGQILFERNPGGAPANVVVTASKLGLTASFIGKVGADPQGDYLRRSLEEARVNVDSVISEPFAFTTVSFAELDPETGERRTCFARKPGADTLLRPEEVNLSLVRSCRVLHFGGVSLTDDPARSSTLFAVEEAENSGALISYDPNYRAALWKSVAAAADEMSDVLSHADLVKLSVDEAHAIFGTESIEGAAYATLARGPRLVAITLGADGAFLATRDAKAYVEAFPAAVVDVTGAGDVFWGAALAWLVGAHEVRTAADIDAMTSDELAACGRYACAAASISVERRGGIPSVPTAREVAERLARE